MIRVLHVVTHMNRGGLETMIMNYYRNIDREKIQFDFLTHRPYDGDYGKEIKELGGEIFHLPLLNPFSYEYKKKLEEFFVSHPEYQIIHVHQDCMSSFFLKAAKKAGVKNRIAHSHNSSQDKNLKYLIKLFYRKRISKYATYLFACGKEAGDWMFCGAEYEILNNAIDAGKYTFNPLKREQVKKQFEFVPESIVIGHVGRFCFQKNHEFIIDVFREIHNRNSLTKLLLVGDNNNEIGKHIVQKIKEYNLENDIVLTGVRSDVADLMQAIDVFLFPSLYEGLPVTLIEAQASGLPCYISDKVPIECKVTNLVQQISLDFPADKWADIIVDKLSTKRRNTYQEICAAGFDIKENALKLQKFYEKIDKGE